MKTKMTALDVKASVDEMTSLVGLRLVNVYDIGSRVLLLKFGHGETKKTVLIEVGVRMHLTNLVREKPKMPSQFTFKLRKHIKKWRLDTIRQLHGDRTIVMRFGSEQTSFHLIVELYARGNIVLTDHEQLILMLLRTHRDGDVNLAVKSTYPIDEVAKLAAPTSATLLQMAEEHFAKSSPSTPIKQMLSSFDNFGPQLAEHALLLSRQPLDVKVEALLPIPSLVAVLKEALIECHNLMTLTTPAGGVLVKEPSAGGVPATAVSQTAQQVVAASYVDFAPVMLQQFTRGTFDAEHKASFGDVCDQFFLRSEMERIDQHNDKKETAVVSTKDRFLKDHARRIGKLETDEELNIKKGRMLEANAESVQEVIDLMNMLLAMKLGWDKIRVLVKARQSEGHPVAYMIHDIHFDRNSVTVLLEDDLQDDEEDTDVQPQAVEVDLSLNAQRNASRYYTIKKKVHEKLEKTIAATDKAAAGAERKGQRTAAKHGAAKKEVISQRTPLWFEKFLWFLTSFGDLVVSGRDSQQTDLLVKKYMSHNDLFVHSDATKAFPCIVKSRAERACLPMASIQEAGAICVSRSSAWDSKASVSAWWVSAKVVGRDSSSPGLFVVSGERNYLKPMPLSLAVSVVFRTGTVQTPVEWDDSVAAVNLDDLPTAVDQAVPSQPDAVRQDSTEGESNPPVRLSFPTTGVRKKGLSTRSLTQRSQGSASAHESSEEAKGSSVPVPSTASRRTKHKLEKIQKKYGEQDDEERAQCMRALGNRPSKVHKLLEEPSELDKVPSPEEQMSEPEQQDVQVQEENGEMKREAVVAEPSQGHQGLRPWSGVGRVPKPRAEDEPQKINQAMQQAATELTYFTGAPTTDDQIMYAACMCLPSSSALQNTCRVELTHGHEKKGAAAQSILRYFASLPSLPPPCAIAIGHVDAETLQNQLLSNVRVHFPQAARVGGRGPKHVDPK